MSVIAPRVGIIGLGEAGNLGDDLILIATVEAIYKAMPTADITYLSHGQSLDWARLSERRGYPGIPRGLPSRFEIPVFRQNSEKFRDRDVIVFGGGGLLQTSHDPNRPYGWLSYLPKAGEGQARVMATGLGLGPISRYWLDKLNRLGSPFDVTWVRDSDSAELANTELNWSAEQCHDFIDDEFLTSLGSSKRRDNRGERRLGVALREWPGFSPESAVQHVQLIAEKENCSEVSFFVLESNRGEGMDVNFSRSIAAKIDLPTSVVAYRASEFTTFIEDMLDVDVAISMKLHSSAIWATRNVPMYPIFYAPKVAALFGQRYLGFEVFDSVMSVPAATEEVPSASSTIASSLPALLAQRGSQGSRFGSFDRLRFQIIHLVRALRRRTIAQFTLRK